MELLVNTVIGLIKGVDDKWTQLLRDQVATMELMAKRIQELETRQLIPGPVGPPGPQGDLGPPGERGQDGSPGRDGIDGKDGRDGIDGKAGTDGAPGDDGADGLHGRDGLPGLPGRDGLPGKDGKDGIDGLGFDDMAVDYDAVTKTLLLTWSRGDRIVTKSIELPIPRYEGIWKAGVEYTKGAMVTWAGALWHADQATTSKPGGEADGWTLAVKKGQDGRDGRGGAVVPDQTVVTLG